MGCYSLSVLFLVLEIGPCPCLASSHSHFAVVSYPFITRDYHFDRVLSTREGLTTVFNCLAVL